MDQNLLSEEVASEDLRPFLRLVHDFSGEGVLLIKNASILDHALHYFVRGTGTYELNGQALPILAGRLFLVRPGEKFSIVTEAFGPFRMLNIHFDPVESPDSRSILWPYPTPGSTSRRPPGSRLVAPGGLVPGFPSIIRIANTAEYESHFQEVRRWFDFAAASGESASHLRCRGAFLILLSGLLAETKAGSKVPDSRLDLVLERAADVLRQRYREPVCLDDLAREVGLSPSHLSLHFRRRFGVPPMKYLVRLRLSHARDELAFGRRSVKEIATDVGYQSVAHFTRAFHREFHLPPAAYRRMNTTED